METGKLDCGGINRSCKQPKLNKTLAEDSQQFSRVPAAADDTAVGEALKTPER